jgi:tetratricopeptide (TPR) repeat protein
LKFWPDNAVAEQRMAILMAKAQRFDEALNHIDKALVMNSRSARIYLTKGLILSQAGKVRESSDAFSAALKIRPDFAEAHSHLGTSLAMLNQVQDALPHFAEAARLDPTDVRNYLPLAMAQQQLGKNEEAGNTLRRALKLAESQNNNALVAQAREMLKNLPGNAQ